jgi:hypothetical protein
VLESLSIRGAEMVALEDAPIVELKVTNDLFPGRVFTGTAESIYNELKALNPDAVGNVTSVETLSLEKRDSVGPYSCPCFDQLR